MSRQSWTVGGAGTHAMAGDAWTSPTDGGKLGLRSSVATIYVLLADSLSPDQGRQFTDALLDNGGRLAILVSPQVAIVDGDASTELALQTLVGGPLLAVATDDVATLLTAAGGSPELAALLTTLASTTSAASALAEAVRPFRDEDWPGFGCVAGE
jgi:hypothetical protein